jgi:hypothetical protein
LFPNGNTRRPKSSEFAGQEEMPESRAQIMEAFLHLQLIRDNQRSGLEV